MNGEFEYPKEGRAKRSDGTDIPVRSSRSKKNSDKNNVFFKIVKIQIILCVIALGSIFLISKINSGAYDRMKADFSRMTERNMSIGEIIGRIKNGAKYVIEPMREQTVQTAAEKSEAALDINEETGEVIATGEFIIDSSGGADIEEKEAAKGTSFAHYRINAVPCFPVDSKRVTSPFGYRVNPVSGKYGFHTGLDLASKEGSPIYAVFFGTVEEVGENDTWGKYVLLKHSDGLKTYYCHMSEIFAESRAVIRKGEIIGLVGSTGWSTGPHLHFEVRINEIRVDPAVLLFPNGYEA